MFDADGRPVHYITGSAQLNDLCQQWSELDCLALDTEFIRTDSFYAKLGLLQIDDGHNCYLIDPLGINDWERFKGLLESAQCEFAVHSASEDLNLLLTLFGCVPSRIFDTQIAAGFLGLGFSLSYQALVQEVLHIEVAKDQTRSDWLQRPLSDSQQLYAALDVRYLLQVKDKLESELKAAGKLPWFQEECRQQSSAAAEFEDPRTWAEMYTNMGNAWRLNDSGLEYLQRLCFWRENEARRRNRPKNWIVRDNELQAIAQQLAALDRPPELADLQRVPDIGAKLVKRNGKSMLAALRDCGDLPPPDRSRLDLPLEPEQRKLLKRCQQVVRSKAEELGLAPELLARKRQVLVLLRGFQEQGEPDWQRALPGWRREQLEPELQGLFEKHPAS